MLCWHEGDQIVFYFCYQDNTKHEQAQEDEADDQKSSGSGDTVDDEEDNFGKESIWRLIYRLM